MPLSPSFLSQGHGRPHQPHNHPSLPLLRRRSPLRHQTCLLSMGLKSRNRKPLYPKPRALTPQRRHWSLSKSQPPAIPQLRLCQTHRRISRQPLSQTTTHWPPNIQHPRLTLFRDKIPQRHYPPAQTRLMTNDRNRQSNMPLLPVLYKSQLRCHQPRPP